MKSMILLLLVFLTNSVLSKEYCTLFNIPKSSTSSKVKEFTFGKNTLSCSEDFSFQDIEGKLPKADLKIIRANKKELISIPILASAHGYQLVKGPINCDELHCEHLSIIELSNYKYIKKYSENTTKKTSNIKIQQIVDLIDSSLWLADVVTLTSWDRKTGSTGNNSAKNWIESNFNDLGLQTSTQAFTVTGSLTHNIIGVQTGITTPDNWYIVGAHMDSRPYSGSAPGAVDNASGCAGVLELARVASLYEFSSTIIFMCYSGEEQGLYGSEFHVNSIIDAGNQSKVKAALTMDMIGYNEFPDYELLLESSTSNQWLIDVLAQNAATYAPSLTVYTSTNPFGSDHVPYIDNNMHGILSIDDDWDDYPAYHESNDLPENLDLTHGGYILVANMAALAQLAGIQEFTDVLFINGFE